MADHRHVRGLVLRDIAEGVDSPSCELVAGFSARDHEVGISGRPASEFVGIQFLEFAPEFVLKDPGVDFHEPVVGADFQVELFRGDFGRLESSLKGAGEDRVDGK